MAHQIATEETSQTILKNVQTIRDGLGLPDPDKAAEKYGYRIAYDDSNPATRVTYLGDNVGYAPAKMNYASGMFDYGGWQNAFFMPKPCMLQYDGTVGYYLNPDDYSLKADGSASDIANANYGGNAMIEWPQIWVKRTQYSGYCEVFIASRQLDNSYKAYSNYGLDGTLKQHFYTPIYNGYYDGTRIRSLSSKTPTVSQTAATEISRCQANGVGWNIETWADRALINDLLVLIGKSTDTQTVFGQGVTGGTSAAISTGTMDKRGLFYGSTGITAGVKVFGIENYWGNIWHRINGLINDNGTLKYKMTHGTQDGSAANGYNTTGSGYLTAPGTPGGTSGGYASRANCGECGILPYQASGSATTHYCDGLWFNNSQNSFGLVGGGRSDGANCGAFSLGLDSAASNAYAYVEVSPSYK